MHSPLEIAKNYIEIGINKARLPILKMLALGIFAGMFIAVAGIGATTAAQAVENPALGRLFSAAIFPAGLAMVLIAGGELCTGNNLMILSALEKKITWREMFLNWGMVYVGNLLGALLVAALVVYGHTPSLFGGKLAESMVSIAAGKVNLSFGDAFIRGMLCNILVCFAVWMSFAAKKVEGKMMISYFPILIFVLCGFEHCVANMYYIGAGLMTAGEYKIAAEGLNWGSFFYKNLLPVSLGNMAGGAGIVGFGCWAIYLRKTPGSHITIEEEQDELERAEEY